LPLTPAATDNFGARTVLFNTVLITALHKIFMFKKFFGKKNDGFYMQVDDAPASKAAPKAEATPVAVAKPAETKAVEAVSATGTETKEVTVSAVATEAAPGTDKASVKKEKTSIKKEKKVKEKKAKDDQPAIETAPVMAVAAPTVTNFATDYLVIPAVAGNRRRPGANMKGFMSMAQEVKVAGMSVGAEIKAKKASKAN
jgi:hypothetical protein